MPGFSSQFSGYLSPNSIGQFALYIQKELSNEVSKEPIFLQVDLLLQDGMIFIEVQAQKSGKELYIIENQTNFEIEYWQENGRPGRLESGKTTPFGWDLPMQ